MDIFKSVNLQFDTWFAGPMGQTTRRPSIWYSKYHYLFVKSCQILCKNSFNLLFLFFYKITKIKIKSFECPKAIRNYEKKILETSDAWSTSRLSHRPSKPAYYIVDCWIFRMIWVYVTVCWWVKLIYCLHGF